MITKEQIVNLTTNEVKIKYLNILMKNENLVKKEFLKSLNINYLNYSRINNNHTKKTVEILNILEKYYNIKTHYDVNVINGYFKRILDYYYFSQGIDESLLNIINKYLTDNSYYYPYLLLYKLLILHLLSKTDHIEEVLLEINKYKTLYINPPFSYIHSLIQVIYSKKTMSNQNLYDTFSEKYRALTYYYLGIKCFTNQKYELAVTYSTSAIELFIKHFNFNRMVNASLVKTRSLLYIQDFIKANYYLENFQHLANTYNYHKDEIEYLYYISLCGCKRYEYLCDIVNNKEEITYLSYLIYLIGLSFCKNIIEKELKIINKDSESDSFIKLFKRYLKKPNLTNYKMILPHIPDIEIKNLITSIYFDEPYHEVRYL